MLGAHTKVNCCSLIISSISRRGPWAEAEPPAGHAVGLAEAVEDQHVLVELGGAGERLVVAEAAIDLVAEQQDAAFAGQLGQRPAASRGNARRRSGWPGLLTMIALVRGVMAASTLATSMLEIGIGVDDHRLAAGQRDEVRIHDEVGIEDDDLVAGIE